MKTVKFTSKIKDLTEIVKECYEVCKERKVQSLSIHPFDKDHVICYVKVKE